MNSIQDSDPRLGIFDKLFALKVGIYITVVEIWLRKHGVLKCQTALAKLAERPRLLHKKPIDQQAEVQRICELVEYGNKRFTAYPADCLSRSLVLQYLLRSHGIDAKLKLGVRNTTGRFESHAWVEHNARPLNEAERVHDIYTEIDWNRERSGPQP